MSTAALELIIRLRDEATQQLQGMQGTIRNVGATMQTAVVAGAVAAGAAVTGFAAASINEFQSFERQLNEVFTLLPGITADAMSEMQADVLAFSRDMAVLPEEVVPALYQALSAGVPQDNVFDFLTTAQKAAAGGVTDLETAVDGISSVVNAYGSEVISAAEASDLMFTAVRLGKTNFEELSRSLFQVNPVASSLGVGFDEITAALAAMTAQGVPTSVATTQLRGLFVELSKEGTKTAKVFEDLAGQNFRDFVAGGGTVQEALQLLEEHAAATGVGINDLFGSVEAGGAALALTGKGTERFTDALAQMADAGGATEAAYGQMAQGIGHSLDRIRAAVAAGVVQVGERLAPAVERAANVVAQHLPAAIDLVFNAFDRLAPLLEGVVDAISEVFLTLEEGGDLFDALGSLVFNLTTAFGGSEETARMLADAVEGIVRSVGEALGPVLDFVAQHVELRDVFAAVALVVASVVIPAVLSLIAAVLPVIAMFAAVVAAVAALRTAWESNFLGMRDIVGTVVQVVLGIPDRISGALSAVQALWQQHGAAVLGALQAAYGALTAAVGAALGAVQNAVSAGLQAAQGFWAAHGQQIIATVTGFMSAVRATVGAVLGAIVQVVTDLLGMARQFWADHGAAIQQIITGALNAVLGIVQAILGRLVAEATALLQVVATIWRNHGDDLQRLARIAWDLIRGIIQQALDIIGGILDAAAALMRGDWEAFGQALQDIWEAVWRHLRTIVETAIPLLLQVVGRLIGSVRDAFTSVDWGSLGRAIIDGIVNALTAGAGRIADTARNLARSAIDAAKNFLDSSSPSRVAMREIGEPIVDGVILALVNGTDKIADRLVEGLRTVIGRADHFLNAAGTLGSIGSFMGDRLRTPIEREMQALQEGIERFAQDVGGEGALEGLMARFGARDLDELVGMAERVRRAVFGGEIEDRDQFQVALGILPMLQRRNELAQDYERIQERIARLAEQRQQVDFLREQMRLLDLIREHGLNAADILQGLTLGLNADPEQLMAAMTRAMQQLIASAEQTLGVQSPSTVFKRIGEQVVQGLALGLERLAAAESAAEDLAAAIIAPVTNPFARPLAGSLGRVPVLGSGQGTLPVAPVVWEVTIHVDARGSNMTEDRVRDIVREGITPVLDDMAERVDTAWRVAP